MAFPVDLAECVLSRHASFKMQVPVVLWKSNYADARGSGHGDPVPGEISEMRIRVLLLGFPPG